MHIFKLIYFYAHHAILKWAVKITQLISNKYFDFKRFNRS